MRPSTLRLVLPALALACSFDQAGAGDGGEGSGSSEGTGAGTTTSSGPSTTATTAATSASTTTTDPGTGGSSDDGPASSGTVDDTGDVLPEVLCGSPPPEGAQQPPPLPTYSGPMCPPVVPGLNTIASQGNSRQFIFVAPSDAQPGEVFPLVFLWHWLGGEAEDFLAKADVQNAADELRFVAAIPRDKGDLIFKWPFTAADPDARLQEEFTFFDDMLACIAEAVPVDTSCVSSTGVSAGALFTSQLGSGRGAYLSSMISLSGGTSGLVRPWGGSPHIMPAMVLWGGPSDFCIAIDFQNTSHDLENELVAAGHPILECVHNCGHSEPPFEPPFAGATPFLGMWRFWLDHPYWLADGESPWSSGVPDTTPEWCAMGVGNAIPRVGECDGPGC
jgi:predicted esterase